MIPYFSIRLTGYGYEGVIHYSWSDMYPIPCSSENLVINGERNFEIRGFTDGYPADDISAQGVDGITRLIMADKLKGLGTDGLSKSTNQQQPCRGSCTRIWSIIDTIGRSRPIGSDPKLSVFVDTIGRARSVTA